MVLLVMPLDLVQITSAKDCSFLVIQCWIIHTFETYMDITTFFSRLVLREPLPFFGNFTDFSTLPISIWPPPD
jgi:hypothetical protein